MLVTSKGQVTIPQGIRKKLNITPHSEVEFVEEKGRVYLLKKKASAKKQEKWKGLQGITTLKMSTQEIMQLSRG